MNTNAINLGQIQVEAGRPDLNMNKIIEQVKNTKQGGILVLPEMAIPGYFIGDDWLNDSYISECKNFNEEIIKLSGEHKITIVWGNIDFDTNKKNEDGSIRKYNASYLASNGELVKTQYKTLLPNYRMFDDKRYFTSLKDLASEENINLEEYYKPVEVIIEGIKTKVSMLICEDIWNINNDYAIDPLEMTKKYSPDLVTVISGSPFGLEKAKFRDKILQIQSSGTTIAYVNPIGIQNNGKNIFNFDGGSSIYKDGVFEKSVKNYEENNLSNTKNKIDRQSENQQIFNALIYTIKEFWKQNNWKKASIGLSGGLDSGLAITLLTIALGKEKITAINMPSKFNSNTTKNLAKILADNLGVKYIIDPIQGSVDLSIKRAEKNRGKKVSSFEIENIQARERGKTLSDNATQFGVYTCNGNKDEIMTGYATLYGDTSGVIALLGDLNKIQVKQLSKWINEKYGETIPNQMIEMKPSAELSDEQNIDNSRGDPFNYKILGAINKAFIEKKKSVSDLIKMFEKEKLENYLGLEKGYLKKILGNNENIKNEIEKYGKLKNNSFFKRIQMPPIPTISKSSFGFEYRESQNKFYTKK